MAEAPPLRGERKIFDPAFLRSHQGDSVCEGRPLAEIAAIDRAKIFNSFDQRCKFTRWHRHRQAALLCCGVPASTAELPS